MKKWGKDEIKILKENTHISNKELARVLNRTIYCIKHQYKKLGLRKQTKFCKFTTEEAHLIQSNKEFNERLVGHLLGDGTLNSDICFTLRNTHQDYINELQEFFNHITNRNNKVTIIPSYETVIVGQLTQCKESYSTTFTCSRIMRPLKKLWYQGKQKIIPRNIALSPLICNRWYCDDGCLYIHKKNSNAEIVMYTDDFLENDVDYLISLLRHQIGISPTKKQRTGRSKRQFMIIIRGLDIFKFLDYIGKPLIKSFDYKWNTKEFTRYFIKCTLCGVPFEYAGFVNYRKHCNQCNST